MQPTTAKTEIRSTNFNPAKPVFLKFKFHPDTVSLLQPRLGITMSRHRNPDDFERGIIEESEHDSKPRKCGILRSFSPLNWSRAGGE